MIGNIINIYSTTAVHDFPDIYNENNKVIVDNLNALQSNISGFEELQKDALAQISDDYTSWQTRLQNAFDVKMAELESKIEGSISITNPSGSTSSVNLSLYATKSWVEDKKYLTRADLTQLQVAYKSDMPKNYLTSSELNRVLEGYVKTTAVPTKLSDLSQDMGYVTSSQLATKLSQTNLSEFINDVGYLTEHQKIKTINGQSILGTGNLVISGGTGSGISMEEVDGKLESYALKTEIPIVPVNVSAFSNDAKYITETTYNALLQRVKALEDYIKNHPGTGGESGGDTGEGDDEVDMSLYAKNDDIAGLITKESMENTYTKSDDVPTNEEIDALENIVNELEERINSLGNSENVIGAVVENAISKN